MVHDLPMATRLNPSRARFNEIKARVEHAMTSTEFGEEAGQLLAQLSTIGAVMPQTDGERRARRSIYESAVHFLYQHDLM